MKTLEATHLSVCIHRPLKEVYDYASNPENMKQWAHGLSAGLSRDGDAWVGEGPSGRVRVRFAARNALGVLDHSVVEPGGATAYMPIRVIANGEGSEVLFTLFRRPGMSDEEFARDEREVRRDLQTLKGVLEGAGAEKEAGRRPATGAG